MDATFQKLSEAFDRAFSGGVETLSPEERRLFLIQDFILAWENGGLSGFFYNRLPDSKIIAETVAAMRYHHLNLLAGVLEKALGLFSGYRDPLVETTWGKVLEQFDPSDQLSELDREIDALSDYGIIG